MFGRSWAHGTSPLYEEWAVGVAGDPDAVRWLETLVWPGPDHTGRIARRRGAAVVAASDPPPIVRGDLLERLEDVAATSPRDATLVVFHSAVLMYLGDDRAAAIACACGDRFWDTFTRARRCARRRP